MAVLAPRLSPHPTADTAGGAPGWALPWEQSPSQPASGEAAPERVRALHCRQKPSGVEGNPFSIRQDGPGLLATCAVPDVPAHTRGSARMLVHRGSRRPVLDGMVLALLSSRAQNGLSQKKGVSHATQTPPSVDVRYDDLHGYGKSGAAASRTRGQAACLHWSGGAGLPCTGRGRATARCRVFGTRGCRPASGRVWGSTSRGWRLLWLAASPLATPSPPLAP